MTAKPPRRTLLARWVGALAGFGLVVAGSPAAAQSTTASPPAEWVAYAERATSTIGSWLQGEDETAQRLRAYLEQTRPAPDQSSPPLVLKVWVDPIGTVSRIDFTPFAHPEPNADLRALIVGRRLAGSPPRDMLLPLRLAVEIAPPQSGPADAAPAPADRSPTII